AAGGRGLSARRDLPQARELGFASRQVTAIEINGTFYGAQRPASFRRWYSETPEDFVFSLKGPRYATHRRDLATAAPSVDRFFASGVLELREKLGPVLWQFAPWTPFDEAAFNAFLESLPRRIDGRAIRHVVEVRHRSFDAPALGALSRRHQVALALAADDTSAASDGVPADFASARLRRCVEGEPTGYAPEALDRWAERFHGLLAQRDRDYFVYFINGAKI